MSNTISHSHAPLTASDALKKQQELYARERKASDEIIRLQSRFESVSSELEQSRAEAMQRFGTSDIGQLRDQYRQIMQANEKSLAAFESNIADAENIIAQINNELNSTAGNH